MLLISMALALVGCSAASQAVKRGDELLKTSNHYGASQEYLAALNLDRAHTEAKIKLCQVSGQAYEQKLATAKNFETSDNYEVALSNYRQLNDFLSNVNAYNCLNFATINVDSKIKEMSSSASEKHYKEAEGHFKKDDFSTAIEKYQDALRISSPYKDSMDKIAESYYRMGNKQEKACDYRLASGSYIKSNDTVSGYKDCIARATDIHYALGDYYLAKKQCRAAWEDFNKANALTPNYKDVSEKMGQADGCSVLKVAFSRFDNPTGKNIAGASVGDFIADDIKSNLQKNASRFLRFLDREELQSLLNEQGLGSKGVTEDYKTFQQLKGVDYFVFGKLTQVNLTTRPNKDEIFHTTGKYQYNCTQKDHKGRPYQATCEGEVPVQFTKHTAGAALTISGSIKLVSVSTGQQVAFKNISERREDSVTYADQVLVPSRFGNVEIEYPEPLTSLTAARKEMKDEDILFKEIVDGVSSSMAREILERVDRTPETEDPKVLTLNR